MSLLRLLETPGPSPPPLTLRSLLTPRSCPLQAHTVQERTGQELERLERSLERREQRLETAGRGQEVRAAKEGLQKVKKQLDVSKAGSGVKR